MGSRHRRLRRLPRSWRRPKRSRDNGDPAFVDQLRSAEQAVQIGYQDVQREQDRRARAAARRRLIWNTALVTMALTSLALLSFLYWLNRRRAPAREKALKAFVERQKSVRAEMDRVLQLFERSREILGTKEKIAARGYDGKTKELVRRDVFESRRSADHVQRSRSRHGRGGGSDSTQRACPAKSKISSAPLRYERGMNRISGEPLDVSRRPRDSRHSAARGDRRERPTGGSTCH